MKSMNNVYKIERNSRTGGYYCIFQKGDKFYYADKSRIPFDGEETMIFPYDKDADDVSDWTDVYCDRSGKALLDCILEFISW